MTQPTTNWWDGCALRTYSDCVSFYKKCKDPTTGKPLKSWGRIFLQGDTFHFYFGSINGLEFGRLTPDNIFTFVASPHEVHKLCAQTFSSSLYRAVPFMWNRINKARYRVNHTTHVPKDTSNGYMVWAHMRSTAPEYFSGIQFDMTTGVCINPKPDLNTTLNEHNRKVWRSALRKFKYGIKARNRIGAFTPLIESTVKTTNNRMTPDWSSPLWLDLLYTSIKDNEFPTELMRGFVSHALYSTRRSNYHLDGSDVVEAVTDVCNLYSIDLRRKFGVFDEVSTMQEADEVSRHPLARLREDDHTPMEM